MKFSSPALASALAAIATPAAAQYGYNAQQTAPVAKAQTAVKEQAAPANKNEPSKKALKAIMELQTAVTAKDTANIPAKLAAAQAVASTKEDRYWIARIQLKASVDSDDTAAAMAAVTAMQATGLASAAELGPLYEGLGGKAFNAKDYATAATAFERQIALDPSNAKALSNLAVVRSAAGNDADAVNVLQRAIKASGASGTMPDEELYKRAVSLAYNSKLPIAADLAQQWVAAYPSSSSWHNAIAIFRNSAKQDTEGTLDLLRLMQATGAMNTAADYSMFINADLDQSNYNEAQAVIDAGIAAKIIDPSSNQFSGTIADLKAKKMPTAAVLGVALKSSPSAFNQLRIGDRFYGMGDYAKAAEIYRQIIGKAGVDPDVVNLHLGMALARSGDKSGAIEAFNAVKGARVDIAKLWLIYAQH